MVPRNNTAVVFFLTSGLSQALMNSAGGRELDTASLSPGSLASKDRTLWDGRKRRGSAQDDAMMTIDGTSEH